MAIPVDWSGFDEIPAKLMTETVVELAYLITENKRGPTAGEKEVQLLPGEAKVVVDYSSRVGLACQVIEMKGKRIMLVVHRDESTMKRYIRNTSWPEHTAEQLDRLLASIRTA